MTWDELMRAYDLAAANVRQEEAEDRARRGEMSGNLIGIRFTKP
jgi:hypothetical protein